ncbi:hypothetical protein DYB36_002597 [Aphanomyces astaci]|uniref:Lon N-terminal domain-containing protein n=1 Tax=Aphanomyces astaci TaxID=112090 RepID=A0A397AY84_APHAT|nr:hypothetical protein DYB36_002597 [Aphanomyces astaci]
MGFTGMEAQKDEDLVTDLTGIHHVGSYARIDNLINFENNSASQLLLVGQRRITIDDVHDSDNGPLRVSISAIETPLFDKKNQMIKAYSNEIVAALREIVKMNPLFKEHMQYYSQRIDIHNPYILADFAASVTTGDGEELQSVLEELDCESRLKKALELLTKEMELSRVQQSIKEQVEEKNFDIVAAKIILDADHYGLTDVKQRILEFIAVSKLLGKVQGRIICLVGPPGVGKTSIGKSIARSLNREFYRFSVGGLSYQGDPASALLELLDPSQNTSFVDHYLDVPVDLSRVLFVCTANVTDTIPGPLLDRMELIRLSGYDGPEKVAIANQYLVPKALEKSGLKEGSEHVPPTLSLTEGSIEDLVKRYCREAGVRNLEQHIEKIFRKVALEVVENLANTSHEDQHNFTISPDKLHKYVGQPRFTSYVYLLLMY